MTRPVLNYRFTFTNPLIPDVVLEAQGETRCIARGAAWQALEAGLTATGLDRDEYWRLVEQLPLGIVSN